MLHPKLFTPLSLYYHSNESKRRRIGDENYRAKGYYRKMDFVVAWLIW